MPFFRYIPVSQVTHVELEGFVSRLTQHHLSSTTISQYLVLVRKLLKLAVRQGLLKGEFVLYYQAQIDQQAGLFPGGGAAVEQLLQPDRVGHLDLAVAHEQQAQPLE